MTYNVFGGTITLALSIYLSTVISILFIIVCLLRGRGGTVGRVSDL